MIEPTPQAGDHLTIANNMRTTPVVRDAVVISEMILITAGKAMTPVGIATYVAVVYLRQKGKEATPEQVAEFLGMSVPIIKYQMGRLTTLGVFDGILT